MQPQHWGNVTTCHIGINAKPFHEPPSHTWALTHYICLALLMQVASSGSLKFHTPLRHQYKQLLMSLFLSYKKSRGLWEQPTALGSTLRRFIWLLIRTIPSYLRDRNGFAICWLIVSPSWLSMTNEGESGWLMSHAYAEWAEKQSHAHIWSTIYSHQTLTDDALTFTWVLDPKLYHLLISAAATMSG